jgi:hypothetical protein
VNDESVGEVTGRRRRFSSTILPAWCRCSPKVGEVLPLLHLHSLSGGGLPSSHDRWRAVNAPHLVALVRAGANVANGEPVERGEDQQGVASPVETAA